MRRERNDIIFFWKCLNGKYEVDISIYVLFSNSIDRCTRSSTDKGFLVKVIFVKLNVLEKAILTTLFTCGTLYHKMSKEMLSYVFMLFKL